MIVVKVYDSNGLGEFFEKLLSQSFSVVSFDIETDGPSFLENKILSMQVRLNNEDRVYVILGEDVVLKTFERLIALPVELLGHNIKFDLKFLLKKLENKLSEKKKRLIGVKLFDTMIAYLLTCVGLPECGGDRGNFISLQDLLARELGIYISKETRSQFEGASDLSEDMIEYAARDVFYLYDLREKLLEKLNKIKHVKIFEMEMRLLPAVIWMEINGIKIDKERLKILSNKHFDEFAKARDLLIKKIIPAVQEKFSGKTLLFFLIEVLELKPKTKKMASTLEAVRIDSLPGYEILLDLINVASPKQMKNILNKVFNIKIPDTNEKTINQALRKLDLNKDQRELLELILNMRDHFKKFTAFGEKYSKYIASDGRIHAEFHQLGTDTGRFSSSSPNLQQVPRDNEYRKMFIADEGKKIVSADFSQMELRAMFGLSREKKGIEAYEKGIDIHRLTASIIFDKPIEEVTDEERSKAKSVNFAVIYGTTAKGLQYNLDLPEDKARDILDRFFKGYPSMKRFIDLVSKEVIRRGYSITPLGRKRFFKVPKVFKDEKDRISKLNRIKRQGVNHVIQGGCADIVKLAMIKIFYNNPFEDSLKIVLQVHDEIVCEVDEDIAEQARDFIVKSMETAFESIIKNVPVKVDSRIENHWSK